MANVAVPSGSALRSPTSLAAGEVGLGVVNGEEGRSAGLVLPR